MHRALCRYLPNPSDDADLLHRYGNLVDRLARWLVLRTGMHNAYDDLWSAGALGLLEASRRFDAERGATFETFAEHRIRGAMLDELRRMDHLPRRLRSRTDDLKKARHKLGGELGREATLEELAREMSVAVEEAAEIEGLLEPPVPLDSVLSMLSTSHDLDDEASRREALRSLTVAIDRLPERLRLVLSLVYLESLTYSEISPLLGVSQPRVCQLHNDALLRLRKEMGIAGEP